MVARATIIRKRSTRIALNRSFEMVVTSLLPFHVKRCFCCYPTVRIPVFLTAVFPRYPQPSPQGVPEGVVGLGVFPYFRTFPADRQCQNFYSIMMALPDAAKDSHIPSSTHSSRMPCPNRPTSFNEVLPHGLYHSRGDPSANTLYQSPSRYGLGANCLRYHETRRS